jgi:hypothetical protein
MQHAQSGPARPKVARISNSQVLLPQRVIRGIGADRASLWTMRERLACPYQYLAMCQRVDTFCSEICAAPPRRQAANHGCTATGCV